jgi:hypothetical protein
MTGSAVYRFLADFLALFLAGAFLTAVAALADPWALLFLPNADSQLSEYFFVAPIRTIVTVYASSQWFAVRAPCSCCVSIIVRDADRQEHCSPVLSRSLPFRPRLQLASWGR